MQGFELQVLRGAHDTLPRLHYVELELSLVPLYRGAPTALDVISFMSNRGSSYSLEGAGYEEPSTGQVLQVEAIFVLRNLHCRSA